MVEKRPVTVAIAVDYYFFFYSEGILTECPTELNHGVLVTGVVENGSENYWIIKNSWSTEWGELGYGRIDRSMKYGNLCEICYAPSYSIV
jgi:KDEL-tailed cysteine endopeptidase